MRAQVGVHLALSMILWVSAPWLSGCRSDTPALHGEHVEDPKSTNLTPRDPGYLPEPLARAALHHFVYEFDPRVDTIPKRIDPLLVARFLHEELDKARPKPGPAERMVELADYCHTTSAVPDLLKRLDRTEQTEADFMSSAALTRGVGLLGDPAQRDLARGYFHHLLTLPFSANRIGAMIDVYEALAPEESTALLRARIEQVLGELRARDDDEPAAGTARRELEDLLNVTLSRVEAALRMKAEVLATSDRDAQLDRLVDVYLGLDLRYYERVSRWAVRMIQRSARDVGKAPVIAAFRRALGRLGPRSEENGPKRSRAVHAIQLFHGELSPEEVAEIRHDQKLSDLLSTD